MNKKIKALMSASLLTTGTLGLAAQSYSSLWKAVEESGAKDQPRQVIEEAMKVYTKAADEGNFPQMMKAWIVVSETKCTLDVDSFNIETLPEVKCSTPVEHSVHNAILGSAYLAMCEASTIVHDEDTQQDYRDKSAECFRNALADKDALAAAKASDYLPVVTKGKNSRLWGNDMYSVITMFVADHSAWNDDSVKAVMHDAVLYYKEHGNLNASTLMELNLLKRKGDDMTRDLYLTSLKQLIDASETLDAGADVAAEYIEVMDWCDVPRDEQWQFVKRAQELFAKSTLRNCFVNAEREMKRPDCRLSYASSPNADTAGDASDLFVYPNQPFCLKVDYQNLTSADVEIREYAGRNDNSELKTSGRLVEKRHLTLGADSTCQARRDKGMPYEGTLTETVSLPAGQYVTVLKSDGRTDVERLNVSSLRILVLTQPEGKRLFRVVDNRTGRPVAGATLQLFDRKERETLVQCDEEGCYVSDDYNIVRIAASVSDTDKLDENYIYVYASRSERDEKRHVKLYTDRTIYRPGQTVHVAGMVYSGDGKGWIDATPKARVTVKLSDANGQEVKCDTLWSNEWGTFDTEITLPKDRLPGDFTLTARTDGTWSTTERIRVEEYKRPTFDVTAKPIEEGRELAFGDTVQVRISARTFAGVPVQGAAVKYTVGSGTGRWRWVYAWEKADEGQTTLDNNGEAVVTIRTTADTTKLESGDMVGYRLTAEVTDLAGETHTAEYCVYVSEQGFSLRLSAAGSRIDLSDPKDTLTVKALNPNGEEVKVSGTYKVLKNKASKNLASGNNASGNNASDATTEIIAEGRFETGKQISLASLPMGTYTLEVSAKDSHGHLVTEQREYAIYNPEEAVDPRTKIKATPTSFDDNLYVCRRPTFAEDKPCEVLLAPCADNVCLYYYIMSETKVFEQKQIELGRHLYLFDIDYKKEYGDGVTLVLAFVRNGQTFTETQTIAYQRPDNRLQLSWKTFRDHLTPGQQEEWILTVKDQDGNCVKAAEMMATMYDASLDQLAPFGWLFSYTSPTGWSPYLRFLEQDVANYLHLYFSVRRLPWKEHDYDRLMPFEYDGGGYFGRGPAIGKLMLCDEAPVMMRAKVANLAMTEEESESTADVALSGRIAGLTPEGEESAATAGKTNGASAGKDATGASNRMRSNFCETAFFYPHLTTDANGDVHIAFTLPESLTTWRLLGMVHTKDIKYGLIDTTCVAKKDLMVQPNMPRFVREGDRVSIVSRVINQGTADLKTCVDFRLLDAESGKVVCKASKTLAVAAGQTEPVAFEYAVTDQHPLLVCEITAEAGNCSDGERNYLPVLTAKQYVTETAPFYVSGGESKTVDLTTLFNGNSPSATQRRMTLEYTANPAWTAIEALQGIRVPDNSSAISYAASLYANTEASRLAQSIPGFKKALQAQRNAATGSASDAKFGASSKANPAAAINSELADNERMKDIVLRESPWLRDALLESDQRAALLDLFDENLMRQRTKTAKDKLTDLQNADGSWSWFDGMAGSLYVTLAVCEDLALLAPDDSEVKALLERGMQYLDQEMYRLYNDSKRDRDRLGDMSMHYLFVSSLLPDRHVSKDVRKMREAWLGQVEKSVRDLTIYGKANCACFLRTFGHEKAADDFLQSVMEYTVSKPGVGRYYATDGARYSWCDYRIPTQLAAMRAVRQSAMADRETVLADMQVWLLRQKQTQMWDNPMNTISAVSYLLADSANLADASVPQFRMDGRVIPAPIDTTKFLARQLGYVHTEIDEKRTAKGVKELEIVPAKREASQNGSQSFGKNHSQEASRNHSRISWGAVSARFLENMDRLQTQSSGELKIARRLLVDGKTFDPQTSTLKVGDRVTVRVTVTADRDMDFVQVHLLTPACFEPTDQSSGYRWMNGRGGYVARHDASTDLFFDTFTKGTMTLDIDYYVTRTGEYLTGAATVQCAYAPEYAGHTGSISVKVIEGQGH